VTVKNQSHVDEIKLQAEDTNSLHNPYAKITASMVSLKEN
jgi:hypothetical protein